MFENIPLDADEQAVIESITPADLPPVIMYLKLTDEDKLKAAAFLRELLAAEDAVRVKGVRLNI